MQMQSALAQPPHREHSAPAQPEFRWEPFERVIEEAMPFIVKHADELLPDGVPFNPDWPQYFALAGAGNYAVFTARVDGKIVGYSSFFLQPYIHSKGVLVAITDVYYVADEHRVGWLGYKLKAKALAGLEDLANAKGIKIIYMDTATMAYSGDQEAERVAAVYKRLGCKRQDQRFGKVLGD